MDLLGRHLETYEEINIYIFVIIWPLCLTAIIKRLEIMWLKRKLGRQNKIRTRNLEPVKHWIKVSKLQGQPNLYLWIPIYWFATFYQTRLYDEGNLELPSPLHLECNWHFRS